MTTVASMTRRLSMALAALGVLCSVADCSRLSLLHGSLRESSQPSIGQHNRALQADQFRNWTNFLSAVNAKRRLHQAQDLVWDQRLATDAMFWLAEAHRQPCGSLLAGYPSFVAANQGNPDSAASKGQSESVAIYDQWMVDEDPTHPNNNGNTWLMKDETVVAQQLMDGSLVEAWYTNQAALYDFDNPAGTHLKAVDFANMVWTSSTAIGCSYDSCCSSSSCALAQFILACRYNLPDGPVTPEQYESHVLPAITGPTSCDAGACQAFAGPLGHSGRCTRGATWCICNDDYGMVNATRRDPETNTLFPICQFRITTPYNGTHPSLLRAPTGVVAAFTFSTRARNGTAVCSTPIDDGVPIMWFKVEPSPTATCAAMSGSTAYQLNTYGPLYDEVVLPGQATCTADNDWEYKFVVPAPGCYDVSIKLGDWNDLKYVLEVNEGGPIITSESLSSP